MGKTLEDAGLLINENGILKVSEPTTIKFLKVRNSRIDELRLNILKINIEDKETYPAFFEKWINTILLNSLKMINLNGNILFPIYDPTAAAAKLEIESPKLGLGELMLAIMSPPGSPIPPIMMGIKPENITDFFAKLQNIISIPEIPLPQPPPIFPPDTLDFTFSILGKHITMNMTVPKIFETSLKEIATPSFFANFSLENLLEIVKKSITLSMPPPPASDLLEYEVNMYVVSEILKDAVSITTLGVSIGSNENGLTGITGATLEHRNPPPPPEKKISNDKIPFVNGLERTSPEFRRKLFDLSAKFGLQPEKVASVIKAETGHSFAPNIRAGEGLGGLPGKKGSIGYLQKTKYSGQKTNSGPAVGLIQFTGVGVEPMNKLFSPGGDHATTISSLIRPNMFPITTSELGDLTAVEQLDYVFAFFLSIANGSLDVVKTFNNGPKLYFAVFASDLIANPKRDPIYVGENAKNQGASLYEIRNGQYVVTNARFTSYAISSLSTTNFLFIKVDEQVFVNNEGKAITKLVYEDDKNVGRKIHIPRFATDTNAVVTT